MNEGLLLGKEKWQEFIKPMLKNYVDVVHDHGAKFILHSCGKIESIFPDLVEIGVDGVESLKPHLNDLYSIKKKFEKKICLLGGIDDTHLLVESTPKEIYSTVLKQCEKLGKGGEFIPGGTNFIGNIPLEKYQAMGKAIHDAKLE